MRMKWMFYLFHLYLKRHGDGESCLPEENSSINHIVKKNTSTGTEEGN